MSVNQLLWQVVTGSPGTSDHAAHCAGKPGSGQPSVGFQAAALSCGRQAATFLTLFHRLSTFQLNFWFPADFSDGRYWHLLLCLSPDTLLKGENIKRIKKIFEVQCTKYHTRPQLTLRGHHYIWSFTDNYESPLAKMLWQLLFPPSVSRRALQSTVATLINNTWAERDESEAVPMGGEGGVTWPGPANHSPDTLSPVLECQGRVGWCSTLFALAVHAANFPTLTYSGH